MSLIILNIYDIWPILMVELIILPTYRMTRGKSGEEE